MIRNSNMGCCDDPCKPKNPCEKQCCDVMSSQVKYDGESIPELCINSGDPLNTVIEKVGATLRGIMKKTTQINHETFEGFCGDNYVELKYDSEEVLLVAYCGSILPAEYYKCAGKKIYFSEDFCKGDDMAAIDVVYRSSYINDYKTPCFGY